MKLKEFIEKFICKNTLIRLWEPVTGRHRMITNTNEKEVCMEWELLKDEVWQSKFTNCEVVGVTDIITDSDREAVNIVIKIS